MNLIGHTESERNLELDEVVLTASSDEIRRIAQFFTDTANRMDKMGSSYDHEHLSDQELGFDSSPQIIVVRRA